MMGGRRRILVVEDDPKTAGQLVDALTKNGYEIDLAGSGNDALKLGRSTEYAVITMDRMLPDIDGLSVMKNLREGGIVAPVLIISALGEIDDRVRGLRAGGDDYLVKPFAFVELVARIEALARRSATVVKETVLRVGDLRLDLVSRTAARLDRQIKLLPGNFSCSNILFATKATWFPGRCCYNMCGIFILTPQPISSMSMSGASVARSTVAKTTR